MTPGGAPGSHARTLVAMTAGEVRDAIARCVLIGDDPLPDEASARLGPIRLRAHQVDAVTRVRQLLAESGGALLADEVGLGKTYVALAFVREAVRPVVVAPAALLPMWEAALEQVRSTATLLSFERLSRAGARAADASLEGADLVVVDEAHHVRTPTTRRYAALAALCARSRVLLLSATPQHNRRRDLEAQLALFLGAAARTMGGDELARYVVRRTRADVQTEEASPPTVAAPVWVDLPTSDDCLESLLGLPPPLPSSDGGDGGALLLYSLVRQWASSRAALRAALRRRLARATGLVAALEAGRYPSRAELAAWTHAEQSVQLAFAELVTVGPADPHGNAAQRADVATLLGVVRAHEAGVRALLRALDGGADPDAGRAAAIREIRARHPGERVLVFAEFAETVEAMFRLLRADGRVAMLRARGAAVSGGPLSRAEALSRFAPIAQGAREPHPSQRVDLLLTTDLLSEGVNLQDASVVVHLDLPWNPARLEQRVGRVSRIGSRHAAVSVYALRPPAAAERLLAVERRLRAKLADAGRTIGVVGSILPGLGAGSRSDHGEAGAWTRVVATLRVWRRSGERGARDLTAAADAAGASSSVAAVVTPKPGFVAGIGGGERPLVVASLDGSEPTASPARVAAALELAASAIDAPVDDRAAAAALDAVERWLARRAAADITGVDRGATARARRRVLDRIARVAGRVPRHLRPIAGPLAAEARRAALMPLAEGAERILAELADAPLADQAWLRALAAFGDMHRRDVRAATCRPEQTAWPVAILLLTGDARQDDQP